MLKTIFTHVIVKHNLSESNLTDLKDIFIKVVTIKNRQSRGRGNIGNMAQNTDTQNKQNVKENPMRQSRIDNPETEVTLET